MFKVLSLYSGAGGLDIGFESTGAFRTLACIDSDDDCIQTLALNKKWGLQSHEHTFLSSAKIMHGDLTNPGEVLAGLRCSKPDVIVGGPPCQAFSVLGKRRGIRDARGGLVLSFMDAVEHLMPKAFVLENVPGFTSIDEGRLFARVFKRAESLGYECWHGKLCAADYGDPTIRKRFFLVGVIQPRRPMTPPPATHQPLNSTGANSNSGAPQQARLVTLQPYRTVAEALAGLGDPCRIEHHVNAHVAINHRDATIARFAALRPGQRDEARRRNRLRLDAPSFTLFAGGRRRAKQARTHIHPELPRELTPRECARLHSFPDYWQFYGPYDSVLTQVANSVPIHLAAAVGRAVLLACG